MEKDKYFLLYASCIPIKGWTNTVVYDLQKNKNRGIPLALHNLINQAKEYTVKDLFKLYETKYHKVILDQFEFLVKEGFGFYTNDLGQFPDLDMQWDHPGIISNAIIDLSGNYELSKVVKLIEKLQCEAVQIIIPKNLKKTEAILEQISDETWVKSIEMLVDYSYPQNNKKLITLCERYLRVNSICFYNSPKYQEVEGKRSMRLIYNDTPAKAKEFFTVIPETWIFVLNIPFFTESKHHHVYFNRKIYIGANGDIKNAPECEGVFGNINKQTTEELITAIKSEHNQKYWHVHKELCDVCKHCEFRNMCFDNRLPYQRKDGSWYHKIECNYNPYIGKWKGEEGYRTLEESGVTIAEFGSVIDYNKIDTINKHKAQPARHGHLPKAFMDGRT